MVYYNKPHYIGFSSLDIYRMVKCITKTKNSRKQAQMMIQLPSMAEIEKNKTECSSNERQNYEENTHHDDDSLIGATIIRKSET